MLNILAMNSLANGEGGYSKSTPANKERLVDAPETVLGIFGFDRTVVNKKEACNFFVVHRSKKCNIDYPILHRWRIRTRNLPNGELGRVVKFKQYVNACIEKTFFRFWWRKVTQPQ